jgi:biofilm PGA synthesis N-glycosyltransferase PgaC
VTQARYVLVTPAKNEEVCIKNTIEAVLSQTIRPEKWVIVSDGSTDRTDEIVSSYEQQYPFIKLVRAGASGKKGQKNFGSKVKAFQAGYDEIRDTPYEFVGNLDADVTFDPDYFERILEKFRANGKLGLAGGLIYELHEGKFVPQNMSLNSVAGAVQLFRREGYESFGGYIPLKRGGVDAAAEIMTRMHGWQVQTFDEIAVMHHRRVSTGGSSILSTRFRQGMTNYLLGYHPVFQIMSCLFRISDAPFLVGGITSLLGYSWAFIKRYERGMPAEAVKYLRSEQMARIASSFTLRTVIKGVESK